MDATSNPNPNEPNPPTLTDLIIIPDESTIPTKSQPDPSNTKELTSKVWEHFTKLGGGDLKEPRATCNYCKKNHTNVILERMGPRPCGDMSESVRRIRIIKTITRINQQLFIITKRLLLRERMILRKLKSTNFPLRK